MRLLVIRRTEFKPLGHVKASAGCIDDASYTRGNAPCLLVKNQSMECKRCDLRRVVFLVFNFSFSNRFLILMIHCAPMNIPVFASPRLE